MLQHVVIQYVAQLHDRLTDFLWKTEVDIKKGDQGTLLITIPQHLSLIGLWPLLFAEMKAFPVLLAFVQFQ